MSMGKRVWTVFVCWYVGHDWFEQGSSKMCMRGDCLAMEWLW